MSPAGVKRPPTILVVDDESSLLRLVTTVLARHYRVFSADSAAAALELWSAHGPEVDLLLTDVVMPGGLSGIDLAARLSEKRPDLKILFMTGFARSAQLDPEFLDRECRQILHKPFTIEDLLGAVRAQLADPSSA